MSINRTGGRAHCALAVGALTAIVGGSVFAAGAADAAPLPIVVSAIGPLGTPTVAPRPTTSLASTGSLVNGALANLGTPAAGNDLLNGTPISAVVPVSPSVPVTVSTGNVLGASSTGSNNASTSSGGTTTSNSSTTSNTSTSSNPSSTSSTSSTSSPSNTSTTTTSTGPTSSGGNTSTNSSGNDSSTTSTSTGATTSSTSSTSSTTGDSSLSQVQLSRSASTVYPSKDGYGDAITFDVRPLDANGDRVAVTGKAYIVLNGMIVKAFDVTATTTTVTWDGLVNGQVVPGSYSFVLDVQSAAGTRAQSTSAFSVSGKKLTAHTVVVKRTFANVKKRAKLPAVVQRNLAYGSVTVRATLKHTAKKALKIDVVRTGTDRHLTVRAGKRASNRITLPAASKSVRIVAKKKSRTAALRGVVLTYRYESLG